MLKSLTIYLSLFAALVVVYSSGKFERAGNASMSGCISPTITAFALFLAFFVCILTVSEDCNSEKRKCV